MGGHVVMEKAAGSHFHQHQVVESVKRGRDHDEEVAGHDHLGVIVDEGEPALLGVWRAHRSATAQVLRDRTGGTRIPSFSGSSSAMRSCPQEGFSAAISRI